MKILDENGEIFAWRLTEKNIHEIKAYCDIKFADEEHLENVYIYDEPDKLFGLGVGLDSEFIWFDTKQKLMGIVPIGGWLVTNDMWCLWCYPDDVDFFDNHLVDEEVIKLVIEDDEDLKLALLYRDILTNKIDIIERYKNET